MRTKTGVCFRPLCFAQEVWHTVGVRARRRHQTGNGPAPPGMPSACAVLGTLLAAASCVWAAPRLDYAPDRITVTTDHLIAVFDGAQGGGMLSLTTRDGDPITSLYHLYTDWGIYPDRGYFGTSHAPAHLTAQERDGIVVVRAEGVLCDGQGMPPTRPGVIAYWLQYTLGDAPQVRVEWGATPSFSLTGVSAFYSLLFGVSGCVGVFANTEDGVLLQDPASHSTRTYQSAELPLSRADPWLGMLRADGTVVAFTDIAATPAFGNVFLHEDGHGNAGVFFAWLCGSGSRDLEAGVEWTGAFTLRVDPTYEAFRASRPQ